MSKSTLRNIFKHKEWEPEAEIDYPPIQFTYHGYPYWLYKRRSTIKAIYYRGINRPSPRDFKRDGILIHESDHHNYYIALADYIMQNADQYLL